MIAALLGLSLALAPARTDADTVRDTVFVVSNRRRVAHGFTRAVTDSLWYGVYVTRLVGTPGPTRAVSPMHVTRVDSLALDESAWRSMLGVASRPDSARRATLVYLHGYSSSPATAVAQGVQVKARGAHEGPLVVFLWPTHDRYVAPPTPTRAYRDDASAAAKSGAAFARVLRAVDSLAPGAVLVAHSMGSRIALDALAAGTPTRAWFDEHPLRAVGFFSPDVGEAAFRLAFPPAGTRFARRVAVYGAASDYLLAASRVMNGERRAAGIAVRGGVMPGVELVDVTRGQRAEPALLTVLGPRHSVRWASAAIADFFGIVVEGAAPSCRTVAATADAEGEGRWRLRSHVTLSNRPGAGCALPVTISP